jgi:hypothetical protein
MSDLRSDMSGLGWICLVTRNFVQRKSREGVKMMCLGLDKLTINKLGNMELRDIMRIIRSNLNFMIQI